MKEMITVEREKLMQIETLLFAIKEILTPTPAMTTEDWQRVIDEGFYVRYVVDGVAMFLIDDNRDISDIELVREKGLRQIHIKGHSHPEGDDEVLVIFNDKTKYHGEGSDECISWDDVREYICL